MPGIEQMLKEMAGAYSRKLPPGASTAVQFDVQLDTGEVQSWHLTGEAGEWLTVQRGPDPSAQFVFSVTEATLREMYDGRLTGMTAAGKATSSDVAPLEIVLRDSQSPGQESRAQLFGFVQHFFNRTVPEKVLLGEDHSRMLHGGHMIPLFYHPGFRSAWGMVRKGERLNRPCDTNPFPQAFIFISGNGFAKIGSLQAQVSAGEAYYVPPGEDHVVWTESDEPLVLIFLAWGEGA